MGVLVQRSGSGQQNRSVTDPSSSHPGEEWLVSKVGAYLPGAHEEVIDIVNAFILTDKVTPPLMRCSRRAGVAAVWDIPASTLEKLRFWYGSLRNPVTDPQLEMTAFPLLC